MTAPDRGRASGMVDQVRRSSEELVQRKSAVGFRSEDEERVGAAHQLARSLVPSIIERFYDRLLQGAANPGWPPSPAQLRRVKSRQIAHFRALTRGPYDNKYVENRLRMALFHEQRGIDLAILLQTHDMYLREMAAKLDIDYRDMPGHAIEILQSLTKLVFLDIGLAIDAYAFARRQTIRRNEAAVEHVNQDLNEVNDELRRSNDELFEFAHVAGHDLQQPLFAAATNLRLIVERCGRLGDAELSQLALATLGAVSQTTQMLEGLLQYARAGAGGEPPQAVDTSKLVSEVVAGLEPTLAETKATVSIAALPIVIAPELQLREVFQNLLGNAFKFSKGPPEIHVTATRTSDAWRFSIRDRGDSVPADDHGRIFELFVRGDHPARGSGVGLAVCRRIIERLGGRIWFESDADGSTFHFTVPA